MIRVFMGDRGSGKTKRMIDMANLLAEDAKSNVVYIDDDQRYMYDLRHEIRFIETSEHKKQKVYSCEWLYGFLCGILATNFDVSTIFLDAFLKHSGGELNSQESFFSNLNAVSERHNVDFVLSINADEQSVPEFIKKYSV